MVVICIKKCCIVCLVVIMSYKIDTFTITAKELSLALESIQGYLYERLLLMSKYLVDIDKLGVKYCVEGGYLTTKVGQSLWGKKIKELPLFLLLGGKIFAVFTLNSARIKISNLV